MVLEQIEGEHVMIIGGTGSLGTYLIQSFLGYKGNKKFILTVVSRDENKQYHMKKLFPSVNFLLGDMRDFQRMSQVLLLAQPTIVILAGALKHIDQCEENITDCIATNVTGVSNVATACMQYVLAKPKVPLKSVLFISTDKACSPVNVYGMSKALSERCITQISGKYDHLIQTKFMCVRYGNVLNSRGSIVPRLVELCQTKGKELTLTDDKMTRFFMTLGQSVDLIFHALAYGKSGETWIPRVPAVLIKDLLVYFSNRYGNPIKLIGCRPGEKIHECLINEAEMARTHMVKIENKEFYVIASSLRTDVKPSHDLKAEFTSEKVLAIESIQKQVEEIIESS